MRFSRTTVFFGNLTALLFISFFAGCLTSSNPFYSETDIIQDARFVGEFISDDLGVTVKIPGADESTGRYLVRLAEGGGTSDYQATLFKLRDSVFVDLVPISERNVFERYQEGAPTASGLLRYISHDGPVNSSTSLHVLFRLSFSDKGIECFGAKKFEDPSNPITKDIRLKFHANGDGVVLLESTKSLQSLVESYASKNWSPLFQDGGLKLTRKKE
jgi:hypothetical protein